MSKLHSEADRSTNPREPPHFRPPAGYNPRSRQARSPSRRPHRADAAELVSPLAPGRRSSSQACWRFRSPDAPIARPSPRRPRRPTPPEERRCGRRDRGPRGPGPARIAVVAVLDQRDPPRGEKRDGDGAHPRGDPATDGRRRQPGRGGSAGGGAGERRAADRERAGAHDRRDQGPGLREGTESHEQELLSVERTRPPAARPTPRHAAELAELALSRTVVRPPFAGTIVRRHVDVGATVSRTGTPVYDLADVDPLYADVNVPERDVTGSLPARRSG